MYSRTGLRLLNRGIFVELLPIGNFGLSFAGIHRNIPVQDHSGAIMTFTPERIGGVVRETRKRLGVTQKELALTSGTGIRFIIELEKGKPTCQIGKVLIVLHTLGIRLELTPSNTER